MKTIVGNNKFKFVIYILVLLCAFFLYFYLMFIKQPNINYHEWITLPSGMTFPNWLPVGLGLFVFPAIFGIFTKFIFDKIEQKHK